jgi:hypothetical protein
MWPAPVSGPALSFTRTMAGVAFEHVAKVYPAGTRAVDDLTLEIRDGGVRGQADVAPTMEWLAEALHVSVLKAQSRGESLLAEPIVYTLDQGTLSRYERRVLVH